MAGSARPAAVLVFDLDNTLHDARAYVFGHINRAMTAYVAQHLQLSDAEADALRMQYWRRYGATLRGLMRHHGTDPRHFLNATHDIPGLESLIISEPFLLRAIRRKPNRKVLFSNAPRRYASSVLDAMNIRHVFDEIFCIEHTGFRPKPDRVAFRRLLGRLKVPASRCIMIDDVAQNLRSAKMLGMKTIWISAVGRLPTYVDRRIGSFRALALFVDRV